GYTGALPSVPATYVSPCSLSCVSFFVNAPATTDIPTLSLHDALPIFGLVHDLFPLALGAFAERFGLGSMMWLLAAGPLVLLVGRSEEHTSELQSHLNLVCRLLIEKKKEKRRTA